jgi:hypothetical protein
VKLLEAYLDSVIGLLSSFIYCVLQFLSSVERFVVLTVTGSSKTKMEALMAKRSHGAVFVVTMAALCLAALLATACAVKTPVSDFPAMRLTEPIHSSTAPAK